MRQALALQRNCSWMRVHGAIESGQAANPISCGPTCIDRRSPCMMVSFLPQVGASPPKLVGIGSFERGMPGKTMATRHPEGARREEGGGRGLGRVPHRPEGSRDAAEQCEHGFAALRIVCCDPRLALHCLGTSRHLSTPDWQVGEWCPAS